ncbi:MAG: transporter substrate-binding domain-containing protein [Firmicutes bacterium]|nr:transporter substrate-binding domain-containing protein [Bacillota bacterium]MBQ3579298.1 transporter substrate-binding domain-containing protein [Bacillota bacterium]MBQ6013164.1 transporter substrate-binding domain-containing protein [Bacillota bacterium]MBQ6259702.1 transporter substrate-binding domain-containing protein [Bacillota bacterium]MBR0115145.1 transporter substrate-binding domain-containing protein [Bacillota bacterium]
MKKIIAIALAALMVLSLAGCGEKKSTKTNLELVATLDQAILSLAAGKCDAVALDGTTAQRYVDQSDGAFAMSGINFDLEMYGIHEGNVAAAKKGEESLINAINECIKVICGTPSGKVKEGYTDTYYTWWVANCRVQAGTDNEAAIDIVGDYNMFEGVTPDENYDYLRIDPDVPKPELDLSNADGVLKSILEKGVLTIATSPDYPSAEWIDDKGVVWGNEMMLAKYFADCLGVELKIETMDFNAVLTAVDTGKVDLGMSGFGWKEDREEAFQLSNGYIGSDDVSFHTIIVPAKDKDNYKELKDFQGKHILAQANSLQQMYVEDQILIYDEQ